MSTPRPAANTPRPAANTPYRADQGEEHTDPRSNRVPFSLIGAVGGPTLRAGVRWGRSGGGGTAGVVVLTDRRATGRSLVDVVRAAADGGARAVVLREKDLPRDERAALADALRSVLAPVGGTLIVAGPDPLGGDAVHLAAAGPYPPPRFSVVGRSCHDATELRRVSTEDYVTLSPAYPTASKPGYGPALGPAGLSDLVAHSPVPVVALGGITTPERAAACVEAGAVGVAVMGAVMRADDPAALVAALTDAVGGNAWRGAVHAGSEGNR